MSENLVYADDIVSVLPANEPKSNDQNQVDDSSASSSSSSSSAGRPSEADWKPCSQAVLSVHESMLEGVSPRQILQQLLPHASVDDDVDDAVLWRVIVNLLTEPPVRSKLAQFNTMNDAVDLLKSSSKIIVLTGAGVSVSCGIPDFRSRNGIYARLRKDFPDLPNPEAMFDLEYFRRNPKPFYEFAREIFPGQFQPSLSHRFVKELECQGKLLRNYTQNIDLLEKIAGIQKVVHCHGSFASASCCACGYNVDCEAVKDAVFDRIIPHCPKCPAGTEFSFMKPDIVFFGEDLPSEFHELFTADKDEVDLLIVIGSSLKVRPVALVPNCVPHTAPQILINREPLNHMNFDIELLGNCDTIIAELCHRLGKDWTKLYNGIDHEPLREILFDEGTSTNKRTLLKRSQSSQPTSPKRPRIDEQQRRKTVDGVVGVDDNKEKTTVDLEELRKMYKPRLMNLANGLEDGTYLFVPPSRCVFSGAEVYTSLDDDSDSNSSSSSSSSSASSSSEDENSDEEADNVSESHKADSN